MLAERQIRTVTSPTLVIDLPTTFVNQRVEVLILALDEGTAPARKRVPPPQFAGRVREMGDVMTSVGCAGECA